MKETQTQKNLCYEWNQLEDLIDKAIEDGEPYIIFKTINIEECKYMQKVAEAKLSKLSDKIDALFFLVAFGVSLTIPFIYERSLSVHSNYNIILMGSIIFLILLIYFFRCRFIPKALTPSIKRLSTWTEFIYGIILGFSFVFGVLALLFIFNRGVTESIGFVVGNIIVIFCILFACIWKSEYDTCNKIILNGERKLRWNEMNP